MQKLAPVSIGAVLSIMESTTYFSFKICWQMDFLMQFMLPMSERTLVLELALAEEVPVPTHFRFVLDLVLSHKILSLFLGIEMSFRFLDCGFLKFLFWFFNGRANFGLLWTKISTTLQHVLYLC